MVAILTRPDDARVLIQGKGDLGFESQAGAFEDDLGGELVAHIFSLLKSITLLTKF
jgi:hypothetical protein